MIKKLIPAALLLFIIVSACKEKKPEIANFTGFTQGTTYSIVYDNQKSIEPEDLKIKVEKVLHDFDMSLSLYKDSSIISRINRNENVAADTFFTEVFNKSAQISAMTNGAFDITVGPLVEAWGFGPDGHKSFSPSKLDSLMKLVGMSKVSLVNGHVIKSDPHISLDVNAIAQGYSVDVVCRYFDKLGIDNYLVEIGGEVRGKGTKEGALWKIGIDKPVENGIKYSHEIDPKTGYPAKNTLLSATILANDCAMADGIATACMVMGTEKTIAFINKNPQFSAFLVYSDGKGNFKTWTSDNLKNFIEEE